MTARLYVVDVFAEQRYSGNQLAVVISDRAIADETMQLIAAEMNYSETTFVTPLPERDGGYRVRMFTPAREVAFAGHPILGTAAVVRTHVTHGSVAAIRLNLSVGSVSVTFEASQGDAEVVWFTAPSATPGPTCNREDMAAALRISAEDIASATPIQQVTAGTAAMIVPLRSLDALRRSRLDLDAYPKLAARGHPPLVYLFCAETRNPNNDYSARFFFDAHGVREDPATGNGAAFLGTYLLYHDLQPEAGFSVRIEQGHEVRRPSLVLLRGRKVDGACEVRVGGSVIPTLRGELTQESL